MFESVVKPLLDEGEDISDVPELGGLWSALQQASRHTDKMAEVLQIDELPVADFRNQSILFDVVPGVGCSPMVKLNSSQGISQWPLP